MSVAIFGSKGVVLCRLGFSSTSGSVNWSCSSNLSWNRNALLHISDSRVRFLCLLRRLQTQLGAVEHTLVVPALLKKVERTLTDRQKTVMNGAERRLA